jgi:hypothetical protein
VYDTLDARLGKPYNVSRRVIFNPHFGLRFAWIDQNLSVDYAGTAAANRTKFHGKNDFWGLGGRIGIDTDWILGKGWKIFGNAATSLLVGSFTTNQDFTVNTLSPASVVNLTDDFKMNVSNLEIAVGLDWGRYLKNHRYYLDFRAGYEFHMWWDQFQLRRFSTVGTIPNYPTFPSRGNLTLNGFMFKIQLDM